MISIHIPAIEHFWDEKTEQFYSIKECTLNLEHSLISISKWESITHRPFFGSEKSNEELVEYIKCMTINKDVPDDVYEVLSEEITQEISNYISDDHTATFFREDPQSAGQRKRREIVTSELIYYWMITLNIPVEFEKWHLGRLMTLIRVCSEKNKEAEAEARRQSKGKSRMTTKQQSDLAAKYHAINEARKKKLGTKG